MEYMDDVNLHIVLRCIKLQNFANKDLNSLIILSICMNLDFWELKL